MSPLETIYTNFKISRGFSIPILPMEDREKYKGGDDLDS